MLNGIFAAVVLASVLLAAFTGRMEALTQGLLDAARAAVDVSIGLVGVLALFLGLARLASDAGLLRVVARALGPLLVRLFPSVPPDHPAMSAMVLNISSNLLGLGNAATPFGIKAMMELNRLNGAKGTATDAMVVFLAINTAGLAILPTSILALRSATGSHDVAGVLPATWLAGIVGTIVAITAAVFLSRLERFRVTAPPVIADDRSDEPPVVEESEEKRPRTSRIRNALALFFLLALAAAVVLHAIPRDGSSFVGAVRDMLSNWALPVLVAGVVLAGWARGAKVYDSIVEGAKEGFDVALRILPYLVAVLVMVALFRASGGMEILARWLTPLTSLLGMPAEVLPLALLRPLTGSGAFGVLSDLVRTHGPDSSIGYMASAIHGSTETTFYVLAVYCGAVAIRRTRHALAACLLADAAAILTAVWISNLLGPASGR